MFWPIAGAPVPLSRHYAKETTALIIRAAARKQGPDAYRRLAHGARFHVSTIGAYLDLGTVTFVFLRLIPSVK